MNITKITPISKKVTSSVFSNQKQQGSAIIHDITKFQIENQLAASMDVQSNGSSVTITLYNKGGEVLGQPQTFGLSNTQGGVADIYLDETATTLYVAFDVGETISCPLEPIYQKVAEQLGITLTDYATNTYVDEAINEIKELLPPEKVALKEEVHEVKTEVLEVKQQLVPKVEEIVPTVQKVETLLPKVETLVEKAATQEWVEETIEAQPKELQVLNTVEELKSLTLITNTLYFIKENSSMYLATGTNAYICLGYYLAPKTEETDEDNLIILSGGKAASLS